MTNHHEAPLSYTIKAIDPNGFDEMFTIRGTDIEDHFRKIAAQKKWLLSNGYAPTTPRPTSAATAAPVATNGPAPVAPAGPTPVCQWHGPMRPSTKAPGTFYCPSKMGDGNYCKSKADGTPQAQAQAQPQATAPMPQHVAVAHAAQPQPNGTPPAPPAPEWEQMSDHEAWQNMSESYYTEDT